MAKDINSAEDEVKSEAAEGKTTDGASDTTESSAKETAKPKKKAGKNPFKSKKFKYGGLSVLFTVIFVVAVVLVNVIANLVLDRFDVTVDLTSSNLYSIEDSTANYLTAVDDDVKLIITNEESDFTGNGIYFQQTNEICKKFTNCNSRISLEYVNLLTNPTFASSYDDTLSTAQIIVKSAKTGRYKILTQNDYLSIKYYYNGSEITYEEAYYYNAYGIQVTSTTDASAEQALLSAIMSVTNVDPVRVAFTTGFGETENAAMSELLDKNAYVPETLDMTVTETIDSEIDYLIINAPTADYSNEVLTRIDNWLDNNAQFGKNVIYIASTQQSDTPNLDGFLADWGIKVESGVLYQTVDNFYYPGYPTYMYLDAGDTTYTDGLSASYKVFGDAIRGVTQTFTEYKNLATQVILKSYDGAVLYPRDADSSWTPDNETKGVYNAAVEGSKVRFEGTTPFYSKVIAIGSTEIFNSYFLSATQANNATVMMNMFNTISGKEEGVTLTPKSFSMTTFTIDAATAGTIALIFAVIVPILIIALGITIWVRRKHK